jgi:hypothetical protein
VCCRHERDPSQEAERLRAIAYPSEWALAHRFEEAKRGNLLVAFRDIDRTNSKNTWSGSDKAA